MNMYSLSNFPTEILLKIIPDICPDGIEQLVLSSKRLYDVAKSQLMQHRLEKRMREFVWPVNNLDQGDTK